MIYHRHDPPPHHQPEKVAVPGGKPQYPPANPDTDLAVCRAPCEFYRISGMVGEHCERDVGVNQDGTPCLKVARAAWVARKLGHLPRCEKWPF